MSGVTLRVFLLGHLVHLLCDAAISKMRAPLRGGRGATRMMAGVQGWSSTEEWIAGSRSCMAKWFILGDSLILFWGGCVKYILADSQPHAKVNAASPPHSACFDEKAAARPRLRLRGAAVGPNIWRR